MPKKKEPTFLFENKEGFAVNRAARRKTKKLKMGMLTVTGTPIIRYGKKYFQGGDEFVPVYQPRPKNEVKRGLYLDRIAGKKFLGV